MEQAIEQLDKDANETSLWLRMLHGLSEGTPLIFASHLRYISYVFELRTVKEVAEPGKIPALGEPPSEGHYSSSSIGSSATGNVSEQMQRVAIDPQSQYAADFAEIDLESSRLEWDKAAIKYVELICSAPSVGKRPVSRAPGCNSK